VRILAPGFLSSPLRAAPTALLGGAPRTAALRAALLGAAPRTAALSATAC
jgi:hypothetical protein